MKILNITKKRTKKWAQNLQQNDLKTFSNGKAAQKLVGHKVTVGNNADKSDAYFYNFLLVKCRVFGSYKSLCLQASPPSAFVPMVSTVPTNVQK